MLVMKTILFLILINLSFLNAAERIVSPSLAITSFPSILNFISAIIFSINSYFEESNPAPFFTREIAFLGQISIQELHLVHLELSTLISEVIAPTGHPFLHRLHLIHFVSSTATSERAGHTFAGQYFSFTCASYSCRKYRRVESTGLGAVCPNAQREPLRIF